MFEGIITNILNRVLGDFIEGIKAEQLSISMLSGDVELFNLSIKPDILDNLPLPFKLKYGKVGRIFVDVPVTSLLSSPLKIEVSEIFMLVEPKEKEEWNADIIEKAFISSTQSSLQNLEEYFKGKMEIQNSEPGMASNMINSIIDNMQIDVRNIYLRFEDSISNPKLPYSVGVCLEAIQLYTCNNKWNKEFVSGKDISLKMAKITNFQIFLNFTNLNRGGEEDSIRFDELTQDMHIDDVRDDEIKKIIKTRQERGVEPNPTIVRTKNFLLEEIKGKRKNRNLIERFCIEARVKLNKDPKKNDKPMLDINLVIGGKFKEGKKELVDDDQGIGFFKLQKQQMSSILKYLDYSTEYTKFQTGVQKEFLENKFSKEESRKYMKTYEEWKRNEGEGKSSAEQKKAEKLREQMYDVEKNYAYETIAAIRQISINRYNLEFRKQQEKDTIQKKIKSYENERADGYFSGLWGGRSEEEKEKHNQEIQEYKQELNNKFDEKFKDEEDKMNEDMEDLLQNEPIFDQGALKDMPDDWTQFVAMIVIPKLRFVLLGEDSLIDQEKSIMEVQSSGMKADAKIGQDWQDVDLSFGRLNVIDNISGSDIYQFLTETVFPGNKSGEGKNAIELRFQNNPRFVDGEMKVKLRTMAHQYIFANMNLINQLQDFFAGPAEEEDKIDLSYYTDAAKSRALEYVNQGADYLEEAQKTEYVHKGIDLDLEVFAPVIVIPESICDLTNRKTLIFNLGYVNVSSDLRPYHKDVDYKAINRGEELYDQYSLTLNGFQLSMIEELVDYKSWESAKNKIEIINQISISLKANRSVEPAHPKFPSIELFCKINEIDIFFSDYIMANVLNIQKELLPPPPEEDKVEEINDEEEKDKEKQEIDVDTIQVEGKEGTATHKKNMLKKMHGKSKIRKFESDDDDVNDGDEEEEGEENFEDDDNQDTQDLKNLDAKSLSDVENNPENQMMKKQKKSSEKVDQRILILFDKMKITLGEVLTNDQVKSHKYDGIIDSDRSDIPHVNILELFFEGLEIELNVGEIMNLNLIMNRMIMRDLQKIKDEDHENEDESNIKSLIPPCFHNILSNPDIEEEYDDSNSQYTSGTKTVRTEDFKSIADDDEESFGAVDHIRSPITQLKLVLKIEKETTNIEFMFSDLRLTVTLPIFERLAKFQGKIAKLQKSSEDEKAKAKIEEVRKILNRADDEESESDEDSADENTKEKRLERTREILLMRTNVEKGDKKGSDKGYFEKLKEERNKYLMKGKKLKIRIQHQISKINAKGRLSNFEIWLPLDSKTSHSRVFALNLSSHVGFKGSNLTAHKINEITNEVIESVIQKDQQDANVVITQLSISMINRHLISVQGDLTSEKILLPSRIGLSYDKYLNTPNDSDVTNIEMTIEPIDLKVGFRELNNFRQLGEVMTEFTQNISEPLEKDKQNPEEKDKDRSGVDYQQEVNFEDLEMQDKEIIKNLEQTVKQTTPKIAIRDRKRKQFIKMNVKLVTDSINFSLMDDTGMYEFPLINFNISKVMASVETESGEDDAINFILKKMGISKNPFMKVDACIAMESNYFNMESGSYEPLIEPWMFSALVLQKTKNSGMEIKLTSDQMLNINLTYGMALAVMQIMKKISQKAEEWEDEQKNEETKQRDSSKLTNKQTGSKRKTMMVGDDDDETMGFYFQNFLGMPLRIALENHDAWKDQGIEMSEDDEDIAVINFEEWEDRGERNFRNMKELNSISKHVRKMQNGGKNVENFDENILRYDVYIPGFEPITGIPVEISGRRSYELYFTGQNEKQRKKEKYHYNITVNVRPEGKKKVVSFESQMTLFNKTQFDIEIAQVLTQGLEDEKKVNLKKTDVKDCVDRIRNNLNETQKEKYQDLDLFETIAPNGEFKVPLRWFLDEVAVHYKCERGENIIYNQLIPNLKKLFLKKDDEKKYEKLQKYHLLLQENVENTFFALETIREECRPTALDRPPFFECSVKPPICLNNMTFNDIKVIRHSDEKLIHTIKSGSYAYLYSGVNTDKKSNRDSGTDSEDEKMMEIANGEDKHKKDLYTGEVLFNKYVFKFVDDGNVCYESNPDFFYATKKDYRFMPENELVEDKEEQDQNKIMMTFEVIKFNTFVYTPYILVNTTNIPIYFGEKGSKMNEAKYIAPHSNEFFNPESSKKKKFTVAVEDYDWAEPFDISTLGMAGEASMKRKKDPNYESDLQRKFNSNNLNLGILISALSAPFGKTISVKFVPRYVFMNHCKVPLMLAQDYED